MAVRAGHGRAVDADDQIGGIDLRAVAGRGQRAGIADQRDVLVRKIVQNCGLRNREALQRRIVPQGARQQKAETVHASSFR